MASGITYDGVPSAEGGTIFQGMVFWVAARVPSRLDMLNKIKSNGGTVVPLEKNADMLIADHARKDAPAGSFSWRFIQDSVQNGVVQITDKYRIGPDPDEPRPVAGARLTKGSRTPFTHEDDAQLIKWVLGFNVGRTGNDIYQKYEKVNPRHTWQGWRNRWVKKLKDLPEHQMRMYAATAKDEPAQAGPPSGNTISKAPAPVTAQTSAPQEARAQHVVRIVRAPQAQPAPAVKQKPVEPAAEELQEEPEVADDAPEAEDSAHDDDEPPDPVRDQFYIDLMNFEECDVQDFEWPTLDGPSESYELDLWELGRAFAHQNALRDDADWIEIAEELGWNTTEEPWVADALERCWDERLQDFMDAMNDFDPAGVNLADGAEDEEEAGVALARAQVASRSPDPDLTSTPPGRHGTPKRRHALDHIPSTASIRKRRRTRDAEEIPSTPVEKMGFTIDQLQAIQESPSRLRQGAEPQEELSQQLPSLQRTPLKSRLELRVSSTPDGNGFRSRLEPSEQPDDVTPSQQLRSEALTEGRQGSPLPMDFGEDELGDIRGRRDLDTSSDDVPMAQQARVAAKVTKRTLPSSFAASSRQAQYPPAPTSRPAPRNTAPVVVHSRIPKPAAERAPTVDEWIEDCLDEGFDQSVIDKALRHTTSTAGYPTDLVMQSLANNNGVPKYVQGVWTDDDDRGLRRIMETDMNMDPSDAEEQQRLQKIVRERERLLHKHTPEGVRERKRFLMEVKAGEARRRVDGGKRMAQDARVKPRGDKRKAPGATLSAEEKEMREEFLRRMLADD